MAQIPGRSIPRTARHLLLRLQHPAPALDVRVRQALSYTIDRGLIADKVLGTGEKPAYHFTPDVTAGFDPKPNLLSTSSQQALDERARSLLKEAGWPKQSPRLTLLYNTAEIHKKMALAIANLWKQKLGPGSSSPTRSGKPISTAVKVASSR